MIHGQIKPLFNTPINWGHPLAQGLVASYLMNEGMGDLVHDSCGMNDGRMIGMAPMSGTSGWVPGPHGGALAFPGASGYVDCGINQVLNITGDVAVLSWVYMPTVPPSVATIVRASDIALYSLYLNASQKLAVEWNDGGWKGFVGTTTIPLLRHVMVGFIRINNIARLIVNGQLDKEGVATVPTGAYTGVKIGGWPNSSQYFNGLISSVSIYNRALSAKEIAYLYAFPWCMYDQATPAWAQKDYGREARLANYYRQMRAA